MSRLLPCVSRLLPCVSQVIHEWEKVAAAVVREGGEDDGLKTQMLRLAQATLALTFPLMLLYSSPSPHALLPLPPPLPQPSSSALP